MLACLPKYEHCGGENVLIVFHVYMEKCGRYTWLEEKFGILKTRVCKMKENKNIPKLQIPSLCKTLLKLLQ